MSTLASQKPAAGHASTQARWANDKTVTDPFIQKVFKDYEERNKENYRIHGGIKEHFAENAVWTHPVIGKSAKGAHLIDADGNKYIDMMGGFGSAMMGHNNEIFKSTLKKMLNSEMYHVGSRPSCLKEASELVHETTGFDKCYFFESGTKACHLALRVARAHTKRDTIVMFSGPFWHGQSDTTLWFADEDGKSVPLSAGIPPGVGKDVRLLPWGTDETLQALRDDGDTIAGVMIEAIPLRYFEAASKEFLQGLRNVADEKGFVLIFDEVVSGFRIGLGGAQEHYGVKADLGTYGKSIASGVQIGVLAGKKEIMAATMGIAIGGTFCSNVMQLQAVTDTIRYLQENQSWVYPRLRDNMAIYVNAINEAVETMQIPMKCLQFESLMRFVWDPAVEVQHPHIILAFILALRMRGVYYINFTRFGFGSVDHTAEVMEEAAKAVVDTLTDFHKAGVFASIK